MKDITYAVPCYNSENYMRKCIESLLPAGKRAEIIIVDDGSKDNTGAIADEYAAAYPDIVKVIHQENRGHGGAINHALEEATGRYFKVVDSDDWFAPKAFEKFNAGLDKFNALNRYPDMVIVNYVYDKVGVERKRMMRYDNCLPVDEFFGWDRFGRTNLHQYLLMHAVVYKTEILRESGVKLPEHMFYVDNVFVFIPMPLVKEMYYMNIDLYRYFIGREDQSVNEKVMIGRIDMQLYVTKLLVDNYSFDGPKSLVRYRRSYINIMMEVSSILCMASGDKALFKKKQELWDYVKEKNPALYKKLRRTLFGVTSNVKTAPARKAVLVGYRISNKVYGFN